MQVLVLFTIDMDPSKGEPLTNTCLPYDCATAKCKEAEIKLVGGTASIGLVVVKLICGEASVAGNGCTSENGEAKLSDAKAGDTATPNDGHGAKLEKTDNEEAPTTLESDTSVTAEVQLLYDIEYMNPRNKDNGSQRCKTWQ